ncbi:Ppx/GppA family phosphatase [Aquibaculum sediminis]|uniref:Ppx/GppA family phosphatase n=1 Tax=Aquibaculum sediminis TaxID=3231907 RepID=UPI003456B647
MSAADVTCTPTRPVAPVGVVDIGSNSVRLVVFDGLRRVAVPLFNEKVLCGLGAGLHHSGKLNPEGRALALETLVRFAGLARAMKVSELDLLATAAVRDATDGPDFVRQVEERTGHPVRVLSGGDEARLSALGLLSGQPDSAGVMGDLGGGSLELVAVEQGRTNGWVSLKLGPLRLQDEVGSDLRAARRLIDAELAKLDWLGGLEGRDFYAVGGAWRALARLHMEQSRYPLHMVQGYAIDRGEAEEVAKLVASMGRRSLDRLVDLPARRLETLPYAGMLLYRILRKGRPRRLVFSSRGLREGWILDRLSEEERRRDPLLVAVRDWASSDGRFGDLGQEITAWAAPLFPEESEAQARLRLATSHLSDIGWRYHPDYRAEQTLLRILRAQEFCVEHDERAFIGLALYHRYGGEKSKRVLKGPQSLLGSARSKEAEILGRTLRIAYLLCGGAVEMLLRCRLERSAEQLILRVPEDAPVPPGATIEKRLSSLASSLKLSEARVVSDPAA